MHSRGYTWVNSTTCVYSLHRTRGSTVLQDIYEETWETRDPSSSPLNGNTHPPSTTLLAELASTLPLGTFPRRPDFGPLPIFFIKSLDSAKSSSDSPTATLLCWGPSTQTPHCTRPLWRPIATRPVWRPDAASERTYARG